MTGYTAEDIRSLKLKQADLIFEEDREDYLRQVNNAITENSMAYFEHRLRRKDGTSMYVFCIGRVFYDSVDRVHRTEIIISDAHNCYAIQTLIDHEHDKAFRKLELWESKYRTDPLTGLLNHEAFRNDVEARLLSSNSRAMLLMIDVDRFKQYNDSHGHRRGDEFLILVAQSLAQSLREDDLAGRMGGDEFAAVLFFHQNEKDEVLIRRGQQVCDRINMVLTAGSGESCSVSIGAAFLDKDHYSFTHLYETADKALYASKENGRARFTVFR